MIKFRNTKSFLFKQVLNFLLNLEKSLVSWPDAEDGLSRNRILNKVVKHKTFITLQFNDLEFHSFLFDQNNVIVLTIVIEKNNSVCSKGINNEKERPLNFKIVPVLAVFVISGKNTKPNCLNDALSFLQSLVLLQNLQVHCVYFFTFVLHYYYKNVKIIISQSWGLKGVCQHFTCCTNLSFSLVYRTSSWISPFSPSPSLSSPPFSPELAHENKLSIVQAPSSPLCSLTMLKSQFLVTASDKSKWSQFLPKANSLNRPHLLKQLQYPFQGQFMILPKVQVLLLHSIFPLWLNWKKEVELQTFLKRRFHQNLWTFAIQWEACPHKQADKNSFLENFRALPVLFFSK